jgi:hypothetical protein
MTPTDTTDTTIPPVKIPRPDALCWGAYSEPHYNSPDDDEPYEYLGCAVGYLFHAVLDRPWDQISHANMGPENHRHLQEALGVTNDDITQLMEDNDGVGSHSDDNEDRVKVLDAFVAKTPRLEYVDE